MYSEWQVDLSDLPSKFRVIPLILCDHLISSVVEFRGWWTPSLFTAGIASAKFFLQHVLRQNTLTQARRNISRYYDLVRDYNLLMLLFNNVHEYVKIVIAIY